MKNLAMVGLTDVMELMLNAVCVVDRSGRFIFVSAAFERIFGYIPDEVVGEPMIDFVYPEDLDKTLQTVETLLSGELSPHFENRWVRKDGRVVHILWSARWSEEHQVRIAVAQDITERKKMEEQLRHLAGHDTLTDLPNRALFLDRLQTAITLAQREQAQLSLLFIDMDGFKQINDQHGHFIGDQLLQKIARRLKTCVRESDTVGRLGGDEFLVLLNGTKALDDATMIAENIRMALEQSFTLDQLTLSVHPSIGIAHYPEGGTTAEQLIGQADQAMYRAKKSGGNRIANL